MSSKKLDYYRTRDLARDIADKAFEHLTAPLENRRNDVAREVYEAYFVSIGVTEEQAIKLTGESTEATITLSDLAGNESTVVYTRDNVANLTRYGGHMVLSSPVLYERFEEACKALDPVHGRRGDLANEIVMQISGKTLTAIAKAWPEATPFLRKYGYASSNTDDMVRPLEQLLARFLPALPAPTEAE